MTDEQIERVREELALVYALPFSSDLIGTAWEQILAEVKGASWTGIRDNRPRPDLIAIEDGQTVNYSVKTEMLKVSRARATAEAFLGYHEDFIVARPKVDELLSEGESITGLSPDELGALVLRYYNERIVQKNEWHAISFLLRLPSREFIYWEERPPTLYVPSDYWWMESGRATGGNRNINGYAHSVHPEASPFPRAKFKWTSGGKQFYVLYQIPDNSDIWSVDVTPLEMEEVREALRSKLESRKGPRIGSPSDSDSLLPETPRSQPPDPPEPEP